MISRGFCVYNTKKLSNSLKQQLDDFGKFCVSATEKLSNGKK